MGLPERGCEHVHWKKLAYEVEKVKAAAPAAAQDGASSKLPDARRGAGKLQLSDFTLGRVLGEGNYSRVFLGTLAATGQQVAVKVIEKRKLERYKKQAEALMEKHVLSSCSHPFMVRLHHTFQDPTCLYLCTEYVPGGELWNKSHKTGVRQSLAVFYASELLDVLEYLHAKEIVHRDVKPENILIAADGHIKLIDFGTAKMLGENAPATSGNFKFGRNFKEFVGTAEYMPPEAVNNQPADYRADLWSFGGTIYHLMTGQVPFKGGSEYLTFKRVLELKYRFPVGMPAEARSIVEAMFKVDPRERLGGGLAQEERHAAVKAHPFFAGVRWGEIHSQTPPGPTPEDEATPGHARALLLVPPAELPAPVEIPPPPPPPSKSRKRGPTAENVARMAREREAALAAAAARQSRVEEAVRAGLAYKHCEGLTEAERRRVAFFLDVRGELTEELRIALRMPEPEPEIVDDIEPLPDTDSEEEEGEGKQPGRVALEEEAVGEGGAEAEGEAGRAAAAADAEGGGGPLAADAGGSGT
eukprot:CAMPEP_0206058624 /NCGR_PEP_ID=MMETSP1466-20131121/47096_1 /ASSEMBLY_ACC=CAM_ASM_001126 /TAXON_ID=44452 /ORGANISM="Pavlova gyrans, Strain CCMP608" /LENGTH=527 /DNA_ID=CAMNT_0053433921 /DNA_START=24 /DNA_END=1604 /DNA_ORIENTATION=+